MSYIVEKNVPLPDKKSRSGALSQLPWDRMEVGDSFVYEHNSSGGLRKAAKNAGIEILIKGISVIHTVGHGTKCDKWRIWRVK